MSDLIDRQAAIDAVKRLSLGETDATRLAMRIRDYLERLPSAQPEQLGTNLAEVGADCISRQAAIDALDEIESEVADGYGYQYEKWRKYFCGLPSAQPERIRGRWIEIALSHHTYKCSVCGRLLVNITDGKNNVAKNYPYCHCGADMRGDLNE